MPRDWPDPRFPEEPVSMIELWLVGVFTLYTTAAMLWGFAKALARMLG